MSPFVIALALAAAPVPDPALAEMQAADARLAEIAWRLQTANVALCSADARALPGFNMHALAQYPQASRAAAAAQFGLGAQPAVLTVVPGSAAARAGLAPGDSVLAIDGGALVAPVAAKPSYQAVGAAEDRLDAALATPPARITVSRGGATRQIELAGDRGCPSRVQLIGGGLNSSADGRYVQITDKMYAFAGSEDELAAIVAHELAHNILHHRAMLDAAKAGGGLLPGMGKGGALLRRTESEADRLSVWLVARAGFDVDAVARFWARLRTRSDYGIFSDATHPAWKPRLASLAAAIAEVKAQRAAGALLVPPDMQAKQSSSQP